jgi:hypothetical protein
LSEPEFSEFGEFTEFFDLLAFFYI